MRKCHFCQGNIGDAAIVCPHCRKDTIAGHTTAPLQIEIEAAPVPTVSIRAAAPVPRRTTDRYCQHCGAIGMPVTRVKGSFLLESLLWLGLLIGGLIVSWWLLLPAVVYSVWRLTTKDTVCPSCGAPNMIPVDSPKARAA